MGFEILQASTMKQFEINPLYPTCAVTQNNQQTIAIGTAVT